VLALLQVLDSSRRCSRTAWSQVCSWFNMGRLDGMTCAGLIVLVVVVVVVLAMAVTGAEAPCRLQGRVPTGLMRSL
jgi:hypothetical protein